MSKVTKSPWVIHYAGAGCGGCGSEAVTCFAPVYDIERMGFINTGNPANADILLVTGAANEANRDVIRNIYEQMAEPKAVVAAGACACSGGIFAEGEGILGGADAVVPVDVYVPGCAARPEAIIDGLIRCLDVLEKRSGAGSGTEEKKEGGDEQ